MQRKISKDIFEQKENLKKIKMITRKASYDSKHTGKTENQKSNRSEERIGLSIFKKKFDVLGEICDCQIPLKNKKDDKVGKIDLISYNEQTVTLRLIELKDLCSKETLLRAILEIYTYWLIVDKAKLLADFNKPENAEIGKAVLIYKNSTPYNDYAFPNVKKLMIFFDIELFVLDENNENIIEWHRPAQGIKNIYQ